MSAQSCGCPQFTKLKKLLLYTPVPHILFVSLLRAFQPWGRTKIWNVKSGISREGGNSGVKYWYAFAIGAQRCPRGRRGYNLVCLVNTKRQSRTSKWQHRETLYLHRLVVVDALGESYSDQIWVCKRSIGSGSCYDVPLEVIWYHGDLNIPLSLYVLDEILGDVFKVCGSFVVVTLVPIL